MSKFFNSIWKKPFILNQPRQISKIFTIGKIFNASTRYFGINKIFKSGRLSSFHPPDSTKMEHRYLTLCDHKEKIGNWLTFKILKKYEKKFYKYEQFLNTDKFIKKILHNSKFNYGVEKYDFGHCKLSPIW